MFGAAPAPASPSALPDGARRPMTSVICGLPGFLSSASASLQSSLESSVEAKRLDGAGSTLFSLADLEAEALRCLRGGCATSLRRPARRTSDSGFGSVADANRIARCRSAESVRRSGRRRRRARLKSTGLRADGMEYATGEHGGQQRRAEPTAGGALSNDAAMASWATPSDTRSRSTEHRRVGEYADQHVLHGRQVHLSGSPAQTAKRGQLQSGIFPLAHGVSARVGKLRAAGNAIVPQVAAEFIKAAHG